MRGKKSIDFGTFLETLADPTQGPELLRRHRAEIEKRKAKFVRQPRLEVHNATDGE